MIGRSQLIVALLLVAASSGHPSAQQAAVEAVTPQALARQVQQRFDVLLLRDGVALTPKVAVAGVHSIEVAGGAIAVDGASVSGAELKRALGRDADFILQLSYLDSATLRSLFTPVSSQSSSPNSSTSSSGDEPNRRGSSSSRDTNVDDWRRDNIVRIGSNAQVGENDVVDGDVVAVGGSARVDGHVRGDVVAVMGSVDLGPHAVVDGNVAVVGGELRRADGARVNGRVKEVGWGAIASDWAGRGTGGSRWFERSGSAIFALFSTVTRGVVVSLLAILVVLLAGAYVDQIGARAAAEPFKAGAIGLLAQLLFLPLLIVTIVVFVVTLVLIPLLALLPFMMLGLVLAAVVGFTAVARQLGAVAARQFNWATPSAYIATLIGIGVILLPVLLARLALAAGGTGVSILWHAVAAAGLCLEYLVWTVGFGAVALARFGGKPIFGSRSQPPTPVEG